MKEFNKILTHLSLGGGLTEANIQLFNIGTWSNKEVLGFLSLPNGSSRITTSTNADYTVEVDSLDNILGDINVTFIKMDYRRYEASIINRCTKYYKEI